MPATCRRCCANQHTRIQRIKVMYKLRHISHRASLHLLWLVAALLGSCSEERHEDAPAAMSMVQLSIVAKEENDLNTRAETEEGQAGEYINRLCVLVVGADGVLVKKLLPDLSADELAQKGNLRQWQSKGFPLPEGNYTVYAFANVDTYYGGLWGSLTGLEEGTDVSEIINRLKSYQLDDPASKIDLSEYFIPMTAVSAVAVKGVLTTATIGMDRLVTKVRLKINGVPGIKINAVECKWADDKVMLLPSSSDTWYENTHSTYLVGPGSGVDSLKIGPKGSVAIPDFYINSSDADRHLDFVVTTGEKRGVIYRASTPVRNMQRNSIYPVVLRLMDHGLKVSATVRVFVNGAGWQESDINFGIDDTYDIAMPEGCSFTFNVDGIYMEGELCDVMDCTWSYESDKVSGLVWTDGDEAYYGTPCDGVISATPDMVIPIRLDVTWESQSVMYDRTYFINVYSTNLSDYEFDNSTRGVYAPSGPEAYWRDADVIDMLRMR